MSGLSDTKKVKLPSGLDVEFRRPGPWAATVALANIPTLRAKPVADLPTEDGAVLIKLTGELLDNELFDVERFCVCSLFPKFTTTFPAALGKRHIDTLNAKDYRALLKEFRAFDNTAAEAEEIADFSGTAATSSIATSSEKPSDSPQAPGSQAS